MKAEGSSPDRAGTCESLPEVHGSVQLPKGSGWIRRLFAFAGPAYLVSVGYMDPGNWATDIAGGSRFGYQLIWVLLMSNLMAIVLQTLSVRLGVVTGKDLAQACRDYYPSFLTVPLWLLCELAIVACDLAEVLGTAVGLKLLFGIPIIWGVLITALDVMILLGLSGLGMRRMEAFILALVATVGICFGIEIVLSRPDLPDILRCFIPRDETGAVSIFGRNDAGGLKVLGLHGESLYIAIAILGATVMPHNLYLHSSLVQTRAVGGTPKDKRQACRMNLIDSVVALNCAFFVNAAILILAGAVFHTSGLRDVAGLEDAHRFLDRLLGTSLAPILFAVALLCAGQASTITGTLAGQIVMEGFLRVRIRPWLRRMISRGLAIIPAVIFVGIQGEKAVDSLLVLSQVVLSLQLSFAVIPLVYFTSTRSKMGEFANPRWLVAISGVITVVIVGLNGKLAFDAIGEWFATAGPGAVLPWLVTVPGVGGIGLLFAAIVIAPVAKGVAPWLVRREREVEALAPIHIPSRIPAVARDLVPSKYRRIAVALELGPADPAVIEHVWALATSTGAELILIHIAESAASRFLGEESLDKESREDRSALQDLCRQFAEHGVKATMRLGFGHAKQELVRLVLESKPDLLVTGSHGHRFLQDIILGTTVSGVRHRVGVPVLTVPSRETSAA